MSNTTNNDSTSEPIGPAATTGTVPLGQGQAVQSGDDKPRAPVPPQTGPLGGAVGAGLALVVLPSIALFMLSLLGRMQNESMPPTLVLAMVAIFGIMILLGALALVSTLFARLRLADATQAMGLPAGSIRAFIALALVVLFALISVMLYQCVNQTYRIDDLTETDRAALVKDSTNHVTAVIPHACSSTDKPPCTPNGTTYSVFVRVTPGSDATDLAKQLLILIGTLMTSVTSFYFASRAGDSATKTAIDALATHLTGKPPGASQPGAATGTPGARKPDGDPAASATGSNGAAEDDHPDGCSVSVQTPTEDKDLPAATGGVAS